MRNSVPLVVALALVVGCGDDGTAAPDGGPVRDDGGPRDGGSRDAGGPRDGGVVVDATAPVEDGGVVVERDGGELDAGGDGGTAVPDSGIVPECTPGMTRLCPPSGPPAACSSGVMQRCAPDGTWGACMTTYTSDLCGNSVDDDLDGVVNDGCECGPTSDVEFCGNAEDEDCDGATNEGCVDCDATACVRWPISAAMMCSGASDPTGAGECVGPMYCSSPTGSATTTPPGGCGVPHCGTLVFGDGRERSRYCTIYGHCEAGVPVADGFTW